MNFISSGGGSTSWQSNQDGDVSIGADDDGREKYVQQRCRSEIEFVRVVGMKLSELPQKTNGGGAKKLKSELEHLRAHYRRSESFYGDSSSKHCNNSCNEVIRRMA